MGKVIRDQKSNLLVLQQHNQSQKFQIKLVKNWQKTLKRFLAVKMFTV